MATPVTGLIGARECAEALARLAEQLRPVTVRLETREGGAGSGVIWNPRGLILTNAHVATVAAPIVRLSDGQRLRARVVRRDSEYDLAALEIPAGGLPCAVIRDPSSMRTGEVVLAVGNPFGEPGAVSVGVLAARPDQEDAFMRSDIRLAPGNSGGPLADARGRIVGINRLIFNGFGVSVTATAAQRFLAGLN